MSNYLTILPWDRRTLALEMPARYAATLHSRDPEAIAALFTPDGYLEQVWAPVTGREAIARNYRDRIADWSDATHWVTNAYVEEFRYRTATVRAFVLGLFFFVAGSPVATTLYRGEYSFELAWSGGHWSIARLLVRRHGINAIRLEESNYVPRKEK